MSVRHSVDRMTLGEALKRLETPARPVGSLSSVEHNPSADWDLNTDYEAALALARSGWRDKAAELERIMVQVRDIAPEGFAFNWDVSGESVDVGAFLAGEPECMIAVQPPRTRSVDMLVNVAARSSADARVLLNRGIAIASLVYSLQSHAYGVSLKVGEWVSPTEQGESVDRHETVIEVNQPGEYIDPGRLAFWLGHPAVLRRCIFRFNEQQSNEIRELFGFQQGGGYGYPSNPPDNYSRNEGCVVIPFPDSDELTHYQTPESAMRRIAQIVAAQGIELSMRS